MTDIKVGPIQLDHGVTRFNFWSFMYASFICIGVLAGMNMFQPYVLTEILHLPREMQGTVSGNLGTWQEIVALLLINPFGWLSDRIGRRPVMVFGICVCGIGIGLYPFASTVNELVLCRIIFAVGSAGLAAMIAVIGNDYPAEESRGRMIGFGNVMNGVGVIFMTVIIAQIPALLVVQGIDKVTAGRVMFLTVAFVCLISAVWFRFGLKSGTPVRSTTPPNWKTLMLSGFQAGRNPRILLSYGAAFIGRADVSIKGMFIVLWAVAAAPDAGLTTAEALARCGQLIGILSAIGMLWVGIFGWLLDRVNRVTGMAIAMGLGGIGYSSMWFVSSPLDFSNLPLFIVLALGQMSAICASVTLVGQEAQPAERGAVISMNGFFGAIGILLAFFIGGRLFDAYGPSAPFVMVGLLQVVLFFIAVAVRLVAPGNIDLAKLKAGT
ncbi:MAG: MFS transporter [Gammaproteobacteria bacterium]|nr:MFS transporter [Gammaproteobacteria bacterium]MDP6097685.1 MFS transporter [Gammaproteobacteria bacterium]